MNYYGIRRLFYLILAIVVCFVILGSVEIYVERRLRSELTQRFPKAKLRSLDVNILASTVNLKRLNFHPTGSVFLQLERVRVNPNLYSLLKDIPVIDSIHVDGGSVTYSSVPKMPQETSTLPALNQADGSQFKLPVKVKDVQLNRLVLRHRTNKHEVKRLGYYDGSVSSIGPDALGRGIDLQVTGSRGTIAEGVQLDLTAGYRDELFLSGTVRTQGTNIRLVNRLLERSPLREGSIDALLPFSYTKNQLYMNTISFRSRNVTINPNQRGESHTSSEPGEPISTDSKADTGQYPVHFDGVSLSTMNTKLVLDGDTPAVTVDVKKGFVTAGNFTSLSEDFLVQSHVLIDHPEGEIRCRSTVKSPVTTVTFNPIQCWVSLAQLSETNKLLGSQSPFTFRTGSLQGGLNGEASPKNLNLRLNLNFSDLKVRTRGRNLQFLGIPISVYLSYLSDNEGTLSIQARLHGPPASPALEVNELRNRLITNLGVDAALLATGGLPLYLGNYVVNQTSGYNPVGTIKSTINKLFGLGSGFPSINSDTPLPLPREQ